jgi:hypothetical protein
VSTTISSWQVQKAVSLAMQTLDRLREEDGLVIETDASIEANLRSPIASMTAAMVLRYASP